MMRTLWRLLLGGFALALAIPLGTFVLGAGVLNDPLLRGAFGHLGAAALKSGLWSLVSDLSPEMILDAATAFGKALLILLALPPALAAVIGETLRWRSATWYWGTSGLLTALLPWTARGGIRSPLDPSSLPNEGRLTAILFVAGTASGFVYWAIAGRSAGRRPAPAAASDLPRLPGNALHPPDA